MSFGTFFENDKDVSSLSQDELIAFCISANDFFKNSQEARKDEDYVKLIDPSLYFYHKLISENNMLKPNEEDKMETIIFHGVQMLKENELQTKLTAKELNRLEKTGNLVYLKDVQRATKIQKLPDGSIREVENYNKEGLKDLQQRFLNKDLLITQITFSIIVYDGKTPEIEFIPYSKEHPEYGDFIFKPCYDINSPNYAFLSKTDGAHREGSLVTAYEKDSSIGDEMLLRGGTRDIRLTKLGGKFQQARDLLNNISDDVKSFKEGGKVNVIPAGQLHKNKHHMEEVSDDFKDLTSKGIPVVTEKEDGELVQQAEIERDEIIFNIDVTKKLEELMEDGSDDAALEAGKLLAAEIMENTIDNTGLMQELS